MNVHNKKCWHPPSIGCRYCNYRGIKHALPPNSIRSISAIRTSSSDKETFFLRSVVRAIFGYLYVTTRTNLRAAGELRQNSESNKIWWSSNCCGCYSEACHMWILTAARTEWKLSLTFSHLNRPNSPTLTVSQQSNLFLGVASFPKEWAKWMIVTFPKKNTQRWSLFAWTWLSRRY